MAGKRRKKRGFSPRRAGKVAYRTLVAVSAVIVTVFVIWNLAVRPPKMKAPPVLDRPAVQPTDNPDTEEDESLAGLGPALARKDLFYTFLLTAEDQVSGNTDTIMVCSYDVPNQRLGLVSVPRDTMVDGHSDQGAFRKINAASKLLGVEGLREMVSDMLGIPIDFYVKVDIDSFVRIVDAVGGVDFEVPVKMDYDAPDQDLHIHYEPRLYQGLTGQQVLEIARCRKNTVWHQNGTYDIYDTYPDADIGRTRTQQALLKAIAKKLLSWGSVPKVTEFVKIFNESVETDLTLDNLLYFATSALGVDLSTGISTATFPGDGSVTFKGTAWCYQYDREAALEIINAMLNPYTTEVTRDMVNIL